MKNKKVNYILLPAVAIIWALIFYKIFSAVKHNQSGNDENFGVALVDSAGDKLDSFKLIANYRDPFKDDQLDEGNGSLALRTQNKKKSDVAWPTIKYLGRIKNKDKKYLAIVKINGKSTMLAKHDTIKGIKLLDIEPDSIRISFHKEQKTVKK